MSIRTMQYDEAVGRPGKFEGEARYVPYFWNGMDCPDYEYKRFNHWIACYRVLPDDKKLFPELSRRKVVKLYETNDGFVMEVK